MPTFQESLGPLGAFWAGQTHANEMGTSQANQRNVLEQIATSEQARRFKEEDRPFELDKLAHEKALRPVTLETQKTALDSAKTKLNREKLGDFMGALPGLIEQTQGNPAGDAYLAEAAAGYGLDPKDPRVAGIIQMGKGGDTTALKRFQDAVVMGDPKTRQAIEEARQKAKIGADPANVPAGVKYRTDAEERWRAEDRASKLAIAKAKAAQGDAAKKNKNYSQAYTEYRAAAEAAYAANDTAAGQRLNQLAQEMLEADVAARGAARNTPQAGTPELPPGSGITPRPAAPLPQPSAPPGAGPAAIPGATAAQVQAASIPPGAIQMLQANPNMAAAFDAKYGQGAAAKILGK